MKLPTVVIVGRPNVGKSSFFNRVLGRRAAVVADREGVTRDRHYQNAEWTGVHFQVVDTGGFISKEMDVMDGLVRKQIETAMDEADVVLFLVDGRVGITDLDLTFARVIQRRKRPTLLVANKSESRSVAAETHQYWSLGLGEPWPVSALHGSGVAELLDAAIELLPSQPTSLPHDPRIKVAILGRPNAGKSTMVNSMLGENRVITSEIAGTTRDAIDTKFEYGGKEFLLTDTAGLRRKARVKDEVEYFSNMRALEAIRRSDVCVMLVDAPRGMEIQDFRICSLILELGKGLIVVLNKWDLMEAGDKTFDHLVKELEYKNPDLEGVPFLSVSGLTGKRLTRVLDEIVRVRENLARVLGRDEVIRFFEETVAKHPHPGTSQGPATLTRCCQVMVNPPALAFEVGHPERVIESYKRYLRRQAYAFFGLQGAPVRIWFRSRFKLRTDEELQAYLDWSPASQDADGEWLDEIVKPVSLEGPIDVGRGMLDEDEDAVSSRVMTAKKTAATPPRKSTGTRKSTPIRKPESKKRTATPKKPALKTAAKRITKGVSNKPAAKAAGKKQASASKTPGPKVVRQAHAARKRAAAGARTAPKEKRWK